MPIRNDVTASLPPPPREGTRPPDHDPWFLKELLAGWRDHIHENDEPHDREPDAPYFASDAGSRCLRQLYYKMSGAPRPEMDLPTEWKLSLGTMVHAQLEQVIIARFKEWSSEHRFRLEPIGIPGRGKADVIVPSPLGKVVVDFQTQNGFGYKMAATTFKGGPNGPMLGKEIQVALAVVALDADFGIVANLALEVLGPAFAPNLPADDILRMAAQWTISRERCDALVRTEVRRVELSMAAMKGGYLPVRQLSLPNVPKNAVIVDPDKGRWNVAEGDKVLQFGTAWPCDYCDFRELCKADGPGTSPDPGF